VQGFWSSQTVALPGWQLPPPQVSPLVQALPSVQVTVSGMFTQPSLLSHESAVHGFLSSQLIALPGLQAPPPQVSPPVQALPSLHGSEFAVFTQPLLGSQLSLVQTLPSSQLSAGPALQVPSAQMSSLLQALPSLQGAVLLACVQPLAGSQLSVVQGLPSSQFTAAPAWHRPEKQVSPLVQALPSLQVPATALCWHPLVPSHESAVHGFLSSQSSGPAVVQKPPSQTSPRVHTSPSLHGAELFTVWQPLLLSQLSSVQALPSPQSTALPPWHTPPLQASPMLHASPSSQVASSGRCTQPLPASHESPVQGFWSSQSAAVPEVQTPVLSQPSPWVQGSWSSQVAPAASGTN